MIDIKALLEQFATELNALSDLEGVDAWYPARLDKLPRAILYYLPSPVDYGPGRLRVDHRIRVEILVAPWGNLQIALESALPLMKKVLDHMKTRHSLSGNVSNLRAIAQDVPLSDPPSYGGQRYVAVRVEYQVTDVSGEAFE